jgi:hypothetical protein
VLQAQQDYTWMAALPVDAEVQSLVSDIAKLPQLSKFQTSLSEIRFHNRVFEFHKPLDLLLYLDDGVWVCECCGILSVGCSIAEVVVSFCEDFSMLWDEIAQRPDDELTKQAQDTKRHMLFVVKSVK